MPGLYSEAGGLGKEKDTLTKLALFVGEERRRAPCQIKNRTALMITLVF
jgi:hypothetical protein